MVTEKEGQIDLDESRIFINGEWLSEEELKYSIKTKVSSEDFDIAPIAMALKTLEKAIENSREMKIRLSSDMAEQLEEYAKGKGETVGSIVRDAVVAFLGGELPPPKEDKEEPKEKKAIPPPLIPIPTRDDEEGEEEEEEEEAEEGEEGEGDEAEEGEEEEEGDESDEEEDDALSRRSRRSGRRRRRHID